MAAERLDNIFASSNPLLQLNYRRTKFFKGNMIVDTNHRFTPEAEKIWQSYTDDVKTWLLNHIWCGQCQKISSMGHYSGEIESGLLILKGICLQCDGDVVKITGTPKLRSLWYKYLAKRKIEQVIKMSKIYP